MALWSVPGDSEEYVPFLAGRNGESRMLRDFLAYIAELKPAAVYHWHNFRPTQITRLRQEHGIGDGEAAPLVSGGTLQDLYRIATGMYAFPVPGTSASSHSRRGSGSSGGTRTFRRSARARHT